MKTITLLAAILAVLAPPPLVLSQTSGITLPEVSPKATVSQTIGITEVAVVYHRPSVNQREVWGKLVPYGLTDLGFGNNKPAPWRAGANENTVWSRLRAARKIFQEGVAREKLRAALDRRRDGS